MKKIFFLLVASLILTYTAISPAFAQEKATKPEAPATTEKAKAPAVKAETIAGTLQSITGKVVVVTNSNGIPFDFVVNGATKIKVGGNKAKLADLSGSTGKSVSVKFLPEKTGNLAQSIEVQ